MNERRPTQHELDVTGFRDACLGICPGCKREDQSLFLGGGSIEQGRVSPVTYSCGTCIIEMARNQRSMIPVILESPYSGDITANTYYLQRCILDCLARGETPYASHQMLTDALVDADPEQRELGIQSGLEWHWHAHHGVVYVDRGISRGMVLGVRHMIFTARKRIVIRMITKGLERNIFAQARDIFSSEECALKAGEDFKRMSAAC